MSRPTEIFPYIEVESQRGPPGLMPYMPVSLAHGERVISASGLVDSGAAVNVLPYSIGLHLGAVWDQQTVRVELAGNLADSESRAIVLLGTVGSLPPVRLIFAWARTDRIPLILGQVNFFMEFDVSFSRSRAFFEVTPSAVRLPV